MGSVPETNLKQLYDTLRQVREQFKANDYSLVNQNCNHFTEAFLQKTLNKSLPTYINRLAHAGSFV
jgi:deubiquitinase DESI2